MADRIFENPRLAAIYDPFDPDRSDRDTYEAMVTEFGATSVLDVGCGTGALACRVAAQGLTVIGLDPAAASLVVAHLWDDSERMVSESPSLGLHGEWFGDTAAFVDKM